MNEKGNDGPLKTKAYGCQAAGERLALIDVTLPSLKATDVQIEMELCGLCHTDIHMRGKQRTIESFTNDVFLHPRLYLYLTYLLSLCTRLHQITVSYNFKKNSKTCTKSQQIKPVPAHVNTRRIRS